MPTLSKDERLKKWFEANYLDGDEIQDGQMLSSKTCFEALSLQKQEYEKREAMLKAGAGAQAAQAVTLYRAELIKKLEGIKDELVQKLCTEFPPYLGVHPVGRPVPPREIMLESKIAQLEEAINLIKDSDE